MNVVCYEKKTLHTYKHTMSVVAMPPVIISDLSELAKRHYYNVTFRGRLVFVDPNITTTTSSGLSFRVIVSDHHTSIKGTLWNWEMDAFDFFLQNVQKIFEFEGTSFRVIKDDHFTAEHFLHFSCDTTAHFKDGFIGRFRVLPDPCTLPFLTCIVRMNGGIQRATPAVTLPSTIPGQAPSTPPRSETRFPLVSLKRFCDSRAVGANDWKPQLVRPPELVVFECLACHHIGGSALPSCPMTGNPHPQVCMDCNMLQRPVLDFCPETGKPHP